MRDTYEQDVRELGLLVALALVVENGSSRSIRRLVIVHRALGAGGS